MVTHTCVKFADPSCSGFGDIVRINRQTDRQTDNAGENPTPATVVGVGNDCIENLQMSLS